MAVWPKLVPLAKTPITVTIYEEGMTEDGGVILTDYVDVPLLCNWQDGGKTIMTEQQKYIRISGRAYFDGDPFQNISNITGGVATIFDEERLIADGRKARNPDGTVNYTELRFK